MSDVERREKITAEIVARTGITETMIERLVHGFYAKVRADDMLAPVFEVRIRDWEPHLARMCAFWSSVALISGRYHGTPMAKFDRWLSLFETTARELCPPKAATHLSNWHDGSPPASNSASPARRASCSATAKDFGVTPQEQFNELSVRARSGSGNPYAGSSLVPMLVIGLVLTFAGMIAALLLS